MAMLTTDQQDALQELMNVSMGLASDQLARYLDTLVHLQVPAMQVVSATDMPSQFRELYADKEAYLISQGFIGPAGMQGEAMLLYNLSSAKQLANILGYQQHDVSDAEMLSDISSILTTTFLNSLAAQLDSTLSYSAPRQLSCENNQLIERLQELASRWNVALQVNIQYQVTNYAFQCDMILLIPGSALQILQQQLDIILQDY
ncbi:chemotaxis protein [Alkalimonas sp. MEB108]|uniref:Chemotaxis protein n=1 Tax=Alkalimonas cellulosilytica TaxID=3058395 RepID=A0ABU7J4U9_9GAMM|nr:chemotaxis protein [Alkalimonas sp. MEB108]MEE2001057.1 chemotaxis protein [Alkalimonas sp. MEB108]